MKNLKVYRPSIILCMVCVAFFVKGSKTNQPILYVLGIFLLVIAGSRALLFAKLGEVESLDDIRDDMIVKYLQKDEKLYKDMIDLYKNKDAKLIYGENDGILLYDKETNTYHGSATVLVGAQDIVSSLPRKYEKFIAYDKIFEEVMEEVAYDEKKYVSIGSLDEIRNDSKERFRILYLS